MIDQPQLPTKPWLFQQPEQRLGEDRQPAVVLHQFQARGDLLEHALFLRAGEQAGIGADRCARGQLTQRLLDTHAVQVRVDLLGVEAVLLAGLRNPGRCEVVLHHRHPAVVGGGRHGGLALGDVFEGELVVLVGVRVDRRARERAVELRFLDLAAVARQFQVQRRRNRRGAVLVTSKRVSTT
jgi:hypothetical protein